jgi:ppGpp synthetase/RelA/SpoT-type nucleotidyltranferase
MKEEIKKEILTEYRNKKQIYKDFSVRVKTIVSDILDLNNLQYLYIEERVKSHESLKEKLNNINVEKLEDVQDVCGIRIITYVYKDIENIEEIISKTFISSQLIVDEKLGTDKVGYRSHHWVVSLPEDRLKLPEYQRFIGMKAELQIRTVLQHAWAQIGHKQLYKPTAIFPEKIKRDFSLLAGLLEVADNEFGRISNEITKYQGEIEKQTKEGNLKITIDTISLRQYFDEHYKMIDNVQGVFGPRDDMAEEIIAELNNMGLVTLEDINLITPVDIVERIKIHEDETNYCGIARLIMIVYDSKLYFEKAWKKKWTFADGENNGIYTYYQIDVSELKKKYKA